MKLRFRYDTGGGGSINSDTVLKSYYSLKKEVKIPKTYHIKKARNTVYTM